jgi:hypothetical protein
VSVDYSALLVVDARAPLGRSAESLNAPNKLAVHTHILLRTLQAVKVPQAGLNRHSALLLAVEMALLSFLEYCALILRAIRY